jgi:hypothetical protein
VLAGAGLDDSDSDAVFGALDVDGGGAIQLGELLKGISREAAVDARSRALLERTFGARKRAAAAADSAESVVAEAGEEDATTGSGSGPGGDRLALERDLGKAAHFFSLAAARGNAEAQADLALAYMRGEGLARDFFAARRWAQAAADQQCAAGQHVLAVLLLRGWGGAKDEAGAARLLRHAYTRQGSTRALTNLQLLAADGVAAAQAALVKLDVDIPLLRVDAAIVAKGKCPAGDLGDQQRAVNAAEVLAFDALRETPDDALASLTRAARYNDLGAIFVLGQALYEGDGLKRMKNGVAAKDHPRALYWHRRGEAAHLAHCEHALGVMYDLGQGGVAVDHAEAARLFARAARQGLAAARFNLAVCLRDGLGVAQDVPESVRLTVLAAKQG